MSKPVKLYPIRDRFLHDVPSAVQIVETKAEADELIASGAFTDNPNHGDRDLDKPDLTGGEAAPTKGPADAGPSDSSEEK